MALPFFRRHLSAILPSDGGCWRSLTHPTCEPQTFVDIQRANLFPDALAGRVDYLGNTAGHCMIEKQ